MRCLAVTAAYYTVEHGPRAVEVFSWLDMALGNLCVELQTYHTAFSAAGICADTLKSSPI